MTLDLLLKLLRCHSAALQSSAWPRPHGPSKGPALYLDAADTGAPITELAGIQRKLETAGSGSGAIVRSDSAAAQALKTQPRISPPGRRRKARHYPKHA
jgi:hypothetical protein